MVPSPPCNEDDDVEVDDADDATDEEDATGDEDDAADRAWSDPQLLPPFFLRRWDVSVTTHRSLRPTRVVLGWKVAEVAPTSGTHPPVSAAPAPAAGGDDDPPAGLLVWWLFQLLLWPSSGGPMLPSQSPSRMVPGAVDDRYH